MDGPGAPVSVRVITPPGYEMTVVRVTPPTPMPISSGRATADTRRLNMASAKKEDKNSFMIFNLGYWVPLIFV